VGNRKTPGVAIILHPDRSVRDPYGVISASTLRDVCRHAETWKQGWDDRTFLHNQETRRTSHGIAYADYFDVREYVAGLVDLPYLLICEIALWLVRDKANHWDPFNPVL
jgi:hypothetical protein